MKTVRMRFLAVAFVATLAAKAWAGAPLSTVPGPQTPWAASAADCHNPGVSADGRFVVFVSFADNLVTNDSNNDFDVFVRDRQLGQTILVTVNASGDRSGNGPSLSPSISADGRFVVFESSASDLVAGDTNKVADVFVRDLVAHTTTLVSQASSGVSGNAQSTAPAITPNGRFVLFCSRASNLAINDANNATDLFVRDLVAGTNALVTRNYSNTGSHTGHSIIWDGNRQISDGGRWVAFQSAATDLVRNDLNAKTDVFVRDLQSASNIVVSISTNGVTFGNGNSQEISQDGSGRYLVFQSAAYNLLGNDTNTRQDVYLRDFTSGTTKLVSMKTNGISSGTGDSGSPLISRLGNVVVFLSTANDLVPGDTNSVGADLFRRDLVAETTTLVDSRVSLLTGTLPVGGSAQGLSADGRFVLYLDALSNLVLFDAAGGTRTIVATNAYAADAVLSDDGNFAVFIAAVDATGARNVFIYDRASGTTELVSQPAPGLIAKTGYGGSYARPGSINSNGQFLVFESAAPDIALADTNPAPAVWLSDLTTVPGSAVRLNTLVSGFGRGPSRRPVISADGHWIAYEAIPDSTPVAGLGTRFSLHAFDRLAQTNLLVGGVGSAAAPSYPVFSLQGNKLVFQSSESGVGGYATIIGQIYYRDLGEPTNRLVSLSYLGSPGSGRSSNPAVSADGRYVAYLSSAANLVTNSTGGVNALLWDSLTGSNVLVSASATGVALNLVTQVGFCSGDTLFFQRGTTNYLFDLNSGTITSTTADLANPSFTPDGRFVVGERNGSYSPFDTNATTDVYLLNRSSGAATLVSINRDGSGAGNGKSLSPAVSPDARYVLFRSRASNLAANDLNIVGDVFLRDLVLKRTILLSTTAAGIGAANRFSGNPIFSQDGSTAVLESYASDGAAGDYNDARDVLVLRLNRGDSDHDGLADDWELAYFNTLERDGTTDYDGDGQTDGMEYIAGTDPTAAGSVLRVVTLSSPASGPVNLFWTAAPGKTYRVEYKASLKDPGWTALAGDVVATSDTGTKEDNSAGVSNERYYRVRVLP